MSERSRASWVVCVLATLLAGAIAAAVLVVGPASGRQSTQTRTIAAQRGVVQSTVSGSGNIEPASQLDLGFKASGTVTSIAVHQGEQVGKGQLVATLDPQSAEVALEQARASLQAAEAALAREEETDGEASSSSSTSGQGSSGARAETATSEASPSVGKPAGSGSGASSQSSSSTSSPETSTATREANIASARAAVKSDRLSVQSAEQDVADTRLVAPSNGTIVSLEGEVGETVSGGGTSRASSEAGGSSAGTGASGSSAGATTASKSSSSSSSSSSGAFAVLSDLSSMKLVVPLSESEVGDVKRGQAATVTVEALQGTKLAAHVSEVASLPSSNSGVVSYDVTFQLDQLAPGLKAGMSATAEVVVEQAEGVNVPSSAITAGTVTVIEGTRQTRRAITTGLAGDSATIVISGLKAGERVALPLASTGSASLLSQLRSRSGTGGLGAGLTRGGAGAGGGSFAGGGLGRVVAGGGAGPGG
ncbi:MAG TPA: HlyD family efflux transporter periplasmic adaptor subunit [Solirubrobacteraceae bacterium]|nr:HlyD family efflux transporter periplasmic adaptor subunit [Solirubrobacteraceae bacterium]